MFRRKLTVLALSYFGLLALYSLFSYALVDPNLVLINNQYFWQFQQWAWQHFFANKALLASSYFVLLASMFVVYYWLLKLIRQQRPQLSTGKQLGYYLLLISPLFLAYNALSHDVFNYIFNARMVIEYGADPHTTAAINFPNDLWLRFMHNTHTTAPYGKGWTLLSLIPYSLGFGKFILTWLAFRLFAVVSLVASFFSLRFFSQRLLDKKLSLYLAAAFFLNPLVLLEVVANQHNDLWMMFPAVLGLGLIIIAFKRRLHWPALVGGILLWLGSIYTKLASLALLPIPLFIILVEFIKRAISRTKLVSQVGLILRVSKLLFSQLEGKLRAYYPDVAAVLMFIPLFTNRSQQFLPWYLLWSLIWLPLVRTKLLKEILLVFSFSAMLRYLPWLYAGEYTNQVILRQKLITWSLPVLYLLIRFHGRLTNRQQKSSRLNLRTYLPDAN